MSVLKAENITKIYGGKKGGMMVKALDKFSLEIESGEFVGVMGPSGSGKTTLLNIMATIDTPSSGELFINGTNPMKLNEKNIALFRRKELGFIFQDFNLLDTLTAYENIALALTIAGKKGKVVDEEVKRVSRTLEVLDVLNKYPYEMSGGQKQRVAAVRAIVNNPELILADEPTGALDSKSAGLLLNSIEKLNKDLEATILMVTHDAFTASYAHRILFIKDGKIFNELVRGNDSRKEFFNKIIEVITLLGGDSRNVL